MPRYEYRDLAPPPDAQRAFTNWIDSLDRQFSNRDPDHRSLAVRDALHELYLGRPFVPLAGAPRVDEGNAAPQFSGPILSHAFDPRNVTLEPEYYGDIDLEKYAPRKPLIWFWMMFDRSPAGLNHWLGYRVRSMVASHVLKCLGKNVKIFHGVEVSFGYNLTIEDDCVIHKHVMLDDRGEIVIRKGTSISDYASVYSHAHDLGDYMDVTNQTTEIGPHARIAYHAAVLSGVRVQEDALVGAMALASKEVPPYHVVAGIPAKTVRIKPNAPASIKDTFERR